MKSIDELMWEREVAEHMRQTAGVVGNPPPEVKAAPRRVADMLATVVLAVLVVLVFTSGWWIGWYVV